GRRAPPRLRTPYYRGSRRERFCRTPCLPWGDPRKALSLQPHCRSGWSHLGKPFMNSIARRVNFPPRCAPQHQDRGIGMKTKAAIAYAAGKPLEVVTVDLVGPRAGEVLVEIRASGVCHTDEFTRSGADPEGLFPVIFGHEGAGIVVDVGPGVTSVKKGD